MCAPNLTAIDAMRRANYIKDEGATKLAEAVKKSRSLKFLITQSNDITREGQRVLDRAFEENINCSGSAVPGEHDNIVGEVCSIM
jgi:Ran GTPase-activating protein (RanGAP) involved in mRNA processing and transport